MKIGRKKILLQCIDIHSQPNIDVKYMRVVVDGNVMKLKKKGVNNRVHYSGLRVRYLRGSFSESLSSFCGPYACKIIRKSSLFSL